MADKRISQLTAKTIPVSADVFAIVDSEAGPVETKKITWTNLFNQTLPALVTVNLTDTALTSGRVVIAGASGLLADDADFTFVTDTLTVTKIGAFEAAGAINFASQNMTLVDIDSGTIGGVTLDGAIAGGDQAFTGVGNMTFTDGSIIAAIDGVGTTLLFKAGGLTGTTFIALTSQSGGTDTMILGKTFFYDAGGEYISSDGSILTIAGAVSFSGATIVTADSATIEIGAAGIIKSGSTNTDTLLIAANDTTFITLTTAATDVCTMDDITMSGTWLASGTVTVPALTLGGTLILNGQTFDIGVGNLDIATTSGGRGVVVTATYDGAGGSMFKGVVDSASPAVDDVLVQMVASGNTSTGAEQVYGKINIMIEDPTNATYSGKMLWELRNSSAWNEAMTLSGAGDLWIDGRITTGGETVANNIHNQIGGNFVSGGASTTVIKNRFTGSVTGFAGDTAWITATTFGNTVTTQTATENIGYIAQVRISEPIITDNLTGDITLATNLYLLGVPTEGEFNTSLYVIQAGEDQNFIAFADSDVAHGGTDLAPTDVFGTIKKAEAAAGGLYFASYKDADATAGFAFHIRGHLAENADTTKSTAGVAITMIDNAQISGAAIANVVADGNVFAVRSRVGAAWITGLILDEDGDLWLNGNLTLANSTPNANRIINATKLDNTNVTTYGLFMELQRQSNDQDSTAVYGYGNLATTVGYGKQVTGGYFRALHTSTGNPTQAFTTGGSIVGVKVDCYTNSTGNLTGGMSGIYLQNWGSNNAGSTIADAAGLHIENALTVGTVTAAYGIYANRITGATSSYGLYMGGGATQAIYVAADDVYFNEILFIGDTNTTPEAVLGITTGIQIDQGAATDSAIALKNSNVAHGGTTIADTDTYAAILQKEGGSGGVQIYGLKDAGGVNYGAITLSAYLAENTDTTKSTGGKAIIELWANQISGTAVADIVANGNILMVGCRAGGAWVSRMLLDEDGDLWLNGGITIGGFTPTGHSQSVFGGAYLSDGGATWANRVYITGVLTGAAGDTLSLANLSMDATIITQTAAQTIGIVTQAYIKEPVITKNVTTITVASTLYIDGAPTEGTTNAAIYVVSGDTILGGGLTTGTTTLLGRVQNNIGGDFTSDGGSDYASKMMLAGDVTGGNGDTGHLEALNITANIITQTATENIGYIASLRVNEPNITDNLTGDITVASTAYLLNCPTEGEFNSSLYIYQGGEDQVFISLADSDVAHGRTDLVPTNVFGTLRKVHVDAGGLEIRGFRDSDGASQEAIALVGFLAENMDTTKSDGGRGVVEFAAYQTSGAAVAEAIAGGNTFAWRTYSNGSYHTISILDEDGDLWLNGRISSGGVVPDGFRGNVFKSEFTSDGASSFAQGNVFEGAITGFNDDATALDGTSFGNTIITQNGSDTIGRVTQVYIAEPNITKGGTDTITVAASLYILSAPTEGATNAAIYVASGDTILGGSLTAGTTTPNLLIKHILAGNITSNGSASEVDFLLMTGAVTSIAGDTSQLVGSIFSNTFTTQNQSETIGLITQVKIDEPNITIGNDTVTVAASLYVASAPTEGVTNAAIFMAGGDTKWGGSVDSAAIADQVAIGGYEIGAGNRVLSLSQETAVAVDVDETKFSHKMQVRINGATYFMMLTTT